jgi:hypothetical protein
MKDSIRIKPHHFVDIIRDLGADDLQLQRHPYGHALDKVTAAVLRNRDVVLQVELGADDVCEPCVHNVEGLCDDTIDTSSRPGAPASKRQYNLLVDDRWCARLALRQGLRLTAREFCERLKDRIDDLGEIYAESPPERRAERAVRLKAGVEKFLAPASPAPGGPDLLDPPARKV